MKILQSYILGIRPSRKILIYSRPSYLQIFLFNTILRSLCTVPLSVPLWVVICHCSLSFFQIMEIITSTSQILLHPSLHLLKTAMPQTSWTHIIHIQITPNVQLLWSSINIKYHIRIIYVNLSLMRTPTIICHCLFAMLVYTRQQFIQLLHSLEIKYYDYLWFMWYVKLHCRKVHGTWSRISSTYHFS